MGAVQSAAFGLAISLIVGLSANAATAGIVSAVGQGFGYVIAGAGSLLVGVVHTASGTWAGSFIVMIALAIALSVATALLVRRSPIDLVLPQLSAASPSDEAELPVLR